MNDLLSVAVSNAVAAMILALVAFVVGAVYRRPALVHGLWLLVLLKLVTPPLLLIPIAWPAASEVVRVEEEPPPATLPAPQEAPAAIVVLPSAGDEKSPALESPAVVDSLPGSSLGTPPDSPRWPRVGAILWIAGSLIWFLLALTRLYRFRRLLHFARPASAALQERTRRLAQALRLTRCPRVRLLPGRIAPMLWAIGGPPHLLVPADLLAVLSDEQLDTLLLHELAHLRRRDHWVRVLEFVVMGLYWWHPVVWYARRELREAEEQCCDAWVVSTLPDAGRTYASALLDTLDFLSTAQAAVPPLASGVSQIVDLKRRLTMIMGGTTPRALTWPGWLAFLALGLTVLPMLPALHGQAPSKETNKSEAEVQAAKASLEAARANLKLAEAMLEQKKAAAAQAEVELKAAAALWRRRAALQRRDDITDLLAANKATTGEKKATYRIEITLPADGSVNTKEVVEKIKKVLPEKLHSGIALRLVAQTESSLLAVPLAKQTPAGNSPDDRIDELEKKLEKVLQELHDLRKQMKEPRSQLPRLPGRVLPGRVAPPPAPSPVRP